LKRKGIGAAARPEIPLEPGTRIVADLHLDLEDELGPRVFLRWLAHQRGLPHLVVLGDLFDVWVGPAQGKVGSGPAVLAGLGDLVAAGTRLEIVHGNRDFLLDGRFEAATGARIHPHGFVGLLAGASTSVGASGIARALLMHGDELCTKDLGYQRLKRIVRSRPVTSLAPRLPLPLARGIARRLRRTSVRAIEQKLPEEKSMQAEACRALAAECEASIVVCGHAHARRDERLEGGPRWIVLDAFGRGGDARDVAEVDAAGNVVTGSSGCGPETRTV
jgi:UDP-2,3-diacylglucosamine hydrolase